MCSPSVLSYMIEQIATYSKHECHPPYLDLVREGQASERKSHRSRFDALLDDRQYCHDTELSKRLIHDESVSEEAEASMISKLREACGFEYTNQLQRMSAGTRREQVSIPVTDVFN